MSSTAKYKPALNSKPSVDMPIISVNGHVIDEKSLSEEIQYHPAQSIDVAIQKAGQALVIRELLRQQTDFQDQDLENEEDEFSQVIDKNSQYEKVSSEDCQRYYSQNKEKFMTAPILEVSHILLAAAPDDIEQRVKKKQLAEKLIDILQTNPDSFKSLVVEYSDCPSNKTYGSLGQISKGQTVEEFERQLFPLSEGLHGTPIESRYGYHVTLVNKKIEGKQLGFELVENKIQDYLNHRRYRQAVSDYLYQLVDDAEIKGIELQIEQENIYFG